MENENSENWKEKYLDLLGFEEVEVMEDSEADSAFYRELYYYETKRQQYE